MYVSAHSMQQIKPSHRYACTYFNQFGAGHCVRSSHRWHWQARMALEGRSARIVPVADLQPSDDALKTGAVIQLPDGTHRLVLPFPHSTR